MATLTRSAARIVAEFVAIAVLLAPAIWNGFPLLEYDTGGYLARWFEGVLTVSRSTTYGLFLAGGWPLDFWPVVILQAAAAVWVIGLILRVHRLRPYRAGLLAVIAALAATTALPWLASELLTDIFAGLAVLAWHALVWYGDRIAPRERVVLVVFTGFAASTHSATYAVLLVLSGAALIVWLLNRRLVPARHWRSPPARCCSARSCLSRQTYVVRRWRARRLRHRFGRMLQDGIVSRYLATIVRMRLKLCPFRNELPRDADDFLWGDERVQPSWPFRRARR